MIFSKRDKEDKINKKNIVILVVLIFISSISLILLQDSIRYSMCFYVLARTNYLFGYCKFYEEILKRNEVKFEDYLLKSLENDDSNISYSAFEILSENNNIAELQLVNFFNKAKDDITKKYTLELLALKKTDYSNRFIINMINDTQYSTYLREYGIFILGREHIPKASIAIEKSLTDSNPGIRMKATNALADIEGSKSIDPIGKLLKDNDSSVRKNAVLSLGKFKDPRIPEIILPLLNDNNDLVISETIKILEQYKSQKIVDLLMRKYTNSNDCIKSDIIIALGEIGDKKASNFLFDKLNKCRSSDEVIRICDSLLKLNDKRAVPFLVNLVDPKDMELRQCHIIFLLSEFEDKSSISKLLYVKNHSDSNLVKQSADNALKKIRAKIRNDTERRKVFIQSP